MGQAITRSYSKYLFPEKSWEKVHYSLPKLFQLRGVTITIPHLKWKMN